MTHYTLPRKKYPEDFEKLVKDWCEIKYSLDDTHVYGGRGHAQCGIDIWGHDEDNKIIVFQCKNYLKQLPNATFLATIKRDLVKFESYEHYHKVKKFIIVTALDNTPKLIDHIYQISSERLKLGKCKVEIIFWNGIQDDLQTDKYWEVFHNHYPKFHPYKEEKPDINPTPTPDLTEKPQPEKPLPIFDTPPASKERYYPIEGTIPIARISTPTNQKTERKETVRIFDNRIKLIDYNQSTKDLVTDIEDNPSLQILLFEIFLSNPKYKIKTAKMIEYVVNPLIQHFSKKNKLKNDQQNKRLWKEAQRMYITILNKQS